MASTQESRSGARQREANGGGFANDNVVHPAGGSGVGITRSYKIFALVILFLINLSNYVDRFVMSILVEPIKAEFALTDTQMGILTGFGFSLVYAIMIVPVGRLSDRVNRKWILSASIGFWSIMTALCGMASSYTQLLLARAGVGLGEAGVPATHSLTSDIFSPKQRPMVMALIGVGGPIGAMLGFAVGGYVSQHYGWRSAFMVVGLPGILLAAVVAFLFREPARGLSDGTAAVPRQALSFGATLRLLLGRKAYVNIVLAIMFAAIAMQGPGGWMAAFFMREHHLPPAQLGLWMAGQGVASAVSTMIGGWICARFYRPDGKMLVWVMMGSLAITPLLGTGVFLAPDVDLALMFMLLQASTGGAWLSAYYTAQQELAGARSRSTASSLGLFFFAIVGSGTGPLLVGAFSDVFAGAGSAFPLRHGILATMTLCLPSLLFLALSLRTIASDMEDARRDGEPGPEERP